MHNVNSLAFLCYAKVLPKTMMYLNHNCYHFLRISVFPSLRTQHQRQWNEVFFSCSSQKYVQRNKIQRKKKCLKAATEKRDICFYMHSYAYFGVLSTSAHIHLIKFLIFFHVYLFWKFIFPVFYNEIWLLLCVHILRRQNNAVIAPLILYTLHILSTMKVRDFSAIYFYGMFAWEDNKNVLFVHNFCLARVLHYYACIQLHI